MKKRWLLLPGMLLLAMFWAGCTSRQRAEVDDSPADTLLTDSLTSDSIVDLVEEVPETRAVDELFDDFFFNFAGNKRMQMSRIQFPLPVDDNGYSTQLERGQWHYSHFFMGDGYYCVLVDNTEDDSITKSYTLNEAAVERLNLANGKIKRYDFKRSGDDRAWYLTQVTHSSLDSHPCADFLKFYERFAADSAFQVSRLDNFVTMTAQDEDDEDEDGVTGSIMPEQWEYFKPEIMPHGIVYLVDYGQHHDANHQQVLLVRGVANGLNIELTFRRKEGEWRLVKFVQ